MTLPVRSDIGIGRYHAGERDAVIVPKTWQGGGTTRGILYCHFGGETAWQAADFRYDPNVAAWCNALVKHTGMPLVSCDLDAGFSYAGWGNDTVIARMTEAFAYLTATIGAKADKCMLVGVSLGNLAVLNWARQNLSKVAAAVGIIGVADIEDIRVNNRGGNAASINAAYGGAYVDAAQKAAHNPAFYGATDLSGLKYQGWHSSGDAVCTSATITALVAAIGASASANAIPTNPAHGEPAIANVPVATVGDFLIANA